MPNDVFQYTSNTYNTAINDINSDNNLVDKPNWFKRLISGMVDVNSMKVNALANNLLLKTAYTRRNTMMLLELIDYFMSPHTTSNGTVLFYIKDTASFPFTVSKDDLVAMTAGSLATASLRFEARSSVVVTEVTEVVASASINYTTDLFTVTRAFTTGEKVRLTTSDTLPDPLEIDTDYYVIAVSSTTIRLATSLTNAYNNSYIDLTDSGVGNQTLTLYSFQATMYQQQTVDEYSIGESDGTTGFQEFNLADTYILEDTVEITINSDSYTLVDTWIDSEITDKDFRFFYNTDMSSVTQFGDGTNFGVIPPAFDIYATYAYGGGSVSNVTVVNKVNVYGGSDSNIDGVSNPGSLTGGSDEEGIELAKILAPILLKARNRYITPEDGETLVLAYGGVALCKVISNEYGVLSSKVVCIANGGGQISSALQTEIETYLINRSILKSMDIRVEDATLTSVAVTSGTKLLSGYTWTGGVEEYVRLGWKLFFSEAGYEIISEYNENGVADAVTLINTIFSESYTSSDYTQISSMLSYLYNKTMYRDFEDELQESDAYAFIVGTIDGIDYITITAPTFPLSYSDDEITTYGTLTLSEIT